MRAHQHLIRTFALTVAVSLTSTSLAALQTAAGGTKGTSGFADVAKFLDNLATYAIYLGIPLGILAFIAAGGMLAAGNPEAPGWLVKATLGVGIILLSKGIMA